MTTLRTRSRSSLVDIGMLTLLMLAAMAGLAAAGTILASGQVPPGSPHPAWLGLAAFLGIQLVYITFAACLGGARADPRAQVRYALGLQLQALAEILSILACMPIIALAFYGLGGLVGDLAWQQQIAALVHSKNIRSGAGGLFLALPALTMMIGAWRLHALSGTPGALAAAATGNLAYKELMAGGDVGDLRRLLAVALERLTDKTTPGLRRLWYPLHPRLLVNEQAGVPEYELVWSNCPMQLHLSLHQLEDGRQRIAVECRLRGGLHRLQLFASPADMLAQMQYIETQVLAPMQARLATLSAERQRDALRDQAVENQLRILQAQIEPHFLFNTLANLRHLYRGSVKDGETMLDHLIAYLRSAMDELRAEDSTVVREMDLAMHYLAIMKIRMGERLAYRFLLPDALKEHAFPPAMLVSLVENAIKHGIAASEHGEIVLAASVAGGHLRLSVSDNGGGLSSVGGTGVGLSNIRQRLEAMFGSAAWLEVGAQPDAGFTATIVIPFMERMH